MERVIKAVVNATSLPVTMKTRLGWDPKSIVIIEAAQMAEQAGIKAITLHSRTRVQGYKGKSDWTWIEKLKRAVSLPVIGNGDVLNGMDVMRMFDTGCDGVMIGRGAINNPWIFQEAKHYREKGVLPPLPSLAERIERLLEHLRLSIEWRGEYYGLLFFRKHHNGYLRQLPLMAKVRNDLIQMKSFPAIADYLTALKSCSPVP